MTASRTIMLTPIDVSDHNIQEKIICIRSHRERIFRTQAETIGTQTIFHNYGHGGAGWTFLFGTVHESLRQFEEHSKKIPEHLNKHITVIGAGCYGLLTAIILARRGYSVSILAHEDRASAKAAGFFFPRPRKSSTPQERQLFLSFGLDSHRTYLAIAHGTHEYIRCGARLLPCYFSLDIDPGFQPYIHEKVMDLPERVSIDFQNGKTYNAMRYTTIFMDVPVLMQELERNRQELGIVIIKKTVHAWHDVESEIIFNCTGLGAQQLTGDRLLIPVQGHLITLASKTMPNAHDYMINFTVTMIDSFGRTRDKLLYYAPKENGIIGITFLRGQSSYYTNLHEFDDLLKRARDFFGST